MNRRDAQILASRAYLDGLTLTGAKLNTDTAIHHGIPMNDTLEAAFDEVIAEPSAVRVVMDTRGNRHAFYFESDDIHLSANGETLAACALLPAMKMGRPLTLKPPISAVLAENLSRLQEIHHCWLPEMQTVAMDLTIAQAKPKSPSERTALFFTGGVDSYYTLLKHQETITDLIFVHGFDIAVDDTHLCQQIEQKLRQAATTFGKNFIKIKTDIRAWLDPHGNWSLVTHGAALAAVSHLLPSDFKRVYIASSDTYHCPVRWGSHPITDPLWSSANLSIIHDGCELTRHQKIQRIASNPSVQQTLRVCWKNKQGAYNCGQCEKCLRTMISLHLAGALENYRTFEHPLKASQVALMKEPWSGVMRDYLKTLRAHEGQHKLRWALRLAYLKNRIRQVFKH